MLPFSGYAFNKSHTAGYGLVSYWTAYLKANYPAEYMAALLTSVGDDKDKAGIYLAHARKLGVTVLAPDVNESLAEFAAVGDDVRFGLLSVRNVGDNVIESMIAARKSKGKFTSFSDFLDKVDLPALNKRAVESLIRAGAFDSLDTPARDCPPPTRAPSTQSSRSERAAGLRTGRSLRRPRRHGRRRQLQPGRAGQRRRMARKQLLSIEREMLGMYVSAHPSPPHPAHPVHQPRHHHRGPAGLRANRRRGPPLRPDHQRPAQDDQTRQRLGHRQPRRP